MAPTLYMIPGSAPVRAVMITAKSIGLSLDLKYVDLFKDEQKTQEFLKLNPQHTVPTLVEEDGFVLWDSNAVVTYLVSKYGKDDSLYPKDAKKRALINQRLHFNSAAFAKTLKILNPILYDGKKIIDQPDADEVLENYSFLESFLDGKEWIAGDHVTVADYSVITTVTNTDVLVKIDGEKYPKLVAWMKKVELLPEYDASRKGLEEFKAVLKKLLS